MVGDRLADLFVRVVTAAIFAALFTIGAIVFIFYVIEVIIYAIA